MNKILLALVMTAAIFFSIESCMQKAPSQQSVISIDGTWVVVAIDGEVVEDASLMPIITIVDNSLLQGALSCNSIRANVNLHPKGEGTVSFESVASTKRLCRNMAVENAFLSNLSKIERYTVENRVEDRKYLLVDFRDKNGNVLLTAKRMGDNKSVEAMNTLRGEWVIYSLGTDTILDEITLPFIVDPSTESINGHTGCNSFGGTILLNGAHGVTFPSIAATQAMGDDEQNERESLLMKALNNTTAWNEDSNGRVHFTDSLGHTLFIIER